MKLDRELVFPNTIDQKHFIMEADLNTTTIIEKQTEAVVNVDDKL